MDAKTKTAFFTLASSLLSLRGAVNLMNIQRRFPLLSSKENDEQIAAYIKESNDSFDEFLKSIKE